MKCTECDKEIPAGSVFCPICGSAQFEETVESVVQPEPVEEDVEAKEEPIAEVPEKLRMKARKQWWILAACLVLVVAALVLFAGHRPGFGFYTTASGLFLSDLSGSEPLKLADDGYYAGLVMTENQDHIFYRAWKNGQPPGLYHVDLRDLSKEPEKLAENVGQFYVNARGTRMAYIRDGNLYVYNRKSETLVAEDVAQFLCDEAMDTFAYATFAQVGDAFALTKKWYVKDGSAEPKVVGEDGFVEILSLPADGKPLIFSVDGKFYAYKDNEDILIAENATLTSGVYEDGSFYYKKLNDEEQFICCYFDGKRSVEITNAQNVSEDFGAQPILHWQDKSSGRYFVAVRGHVMEIPLEQIVDIALSEDEKTLCVTAGDENGKLSLYTASIFWGKLGKMRQLARDAESIWTWFVGKKLYYRSVESGGLGTLYCNGKEIQQGVRGALRVHEETGTVLVWGEESSDNQAAVYMVRNGKSVKLMDKVGYTSGNLEFTSNGGVLLRTNVTGQISDLWYFDRSGKGTKLDKYVKGMHPVEKPHRPGSQIYWGLGSALLGGI